jgi:riboflavin kinase / FMN adenylyltransferase
MWIGDQLQDLANLDGPLHLAIGVFDGLHLGHQAVIAEALNGARATNGIGMVCTFDPHPIRYLRPHVAPTLLTCTRQKIRLLKEFGVQHLLLLKFDSQLAETTASGFIHALVGSRNLLRQISVGPEWSFGRDREGNVDRLREFGGLLHFDVTTAGPITLDGEVISSTLIRKAVATGDLRRAERFLGRPFAIYGRVVYGTGRGREIGARTANVLPENGLLPPDGVYAAQVLIDGRPQPSVLNLGTRPTVDPAGERTLEVHLIDFSGDLYGEDIEVVFRTFLRPERKFPSVEELRLQIQSDIEHAQEILKSE